MKDKRILSYSLSQKISIPELEKISAGSVQTSWCAQGSYQHGSWDAGVDVTMDL
jgi:hypothetical protein